MWLLQLQEPLKLIEALAVPPEDMMRHMGHRDEDSAMIHDSG